MRPVDKYKDHKSGVTEHEFRLMCRGSPIWHSVDLGDLFIEGARKSSGISLQELERARLPDFTGKTVLDIGAFGGWYSFEAERRGASRVVALDYHSWAIDWSALGKYMQGERDAGRVGNPYAPPAELIDEVNQPGRRAFDATKKVLGSHVEPVLSRVEDYTPGHTFDIVMYLGVLYHCEDPLFSLKKVAALARETLIVETLGVYLPGLENRAVWDFFGDDSVNSDVTTWWAPNDKGLVDMLRSVGFSRIDITSSYEHLDTAGKTKPTPIRIWATAHR